MSQLAGIQNLITFFKSGVKLQKLLSSITGCIMTNYVVSYRFRGDNCRYRYATAAFLSMLTHGMETATLP